MVNFALFPIPFQAGRFRIRREGRVVLFGTATFWSGGELRGGGETNRALEVRAGFHKLV